MFSLSLALSSLTSCGEDNTYTSFFFFNKITISTFGTFLFSIIIFFFNIKLFFILQKKGNIFVFLYKISNTRFSSPLFYVQKFAPSELRSAAQAFLFRRFVFVAVYI